MATQTERIEMRVSPKDKALIEKAAAISGQALTAFAIANLVERAKEILARSEVTELSDRDRDAFLKILDQEEPTPALVRAVKRHRTRGG
jgi:uncharacterized protein (DUF1778 family)